MITFTNKYCFNTPLMVMYISNKQIYETVSRPIQSNFATHRLKNSNLGIQSFLTGFPTTMCAFLMVTMCGKCASKGKVFPLPTMQSYEGGGGG